MSKEDNQKDRYGCLLMSLFFNNPPLLLKQIMAASYRPKDILTLSHTELVKLWGEQKATRFTGFRKSFHPELELEKLADKQVGFVSYTDEAYPPLLKHITDPPVGLFYKGRWNKTYFEKNCVAIVGTRKPSDYGVRHAREFSRSLSGHAVTIVSGMAQGIDTEAHEGALEAGGTTVAVLGGPIDHIYPPQNKSLYERIINNNGLVISEMPISTKVERWHFAARNRIVSGMCRGVFVVEGAVKSGSLITARLALQEGREVWALPGHIDTVNTQAPFLLLKEGAAYLVTSVKDILDTLRIDSKNKQATLINDFNETEQIIVDLLRAGALASDELFMKLKIPLQHLQQSLLTLEMSGVIKKTLTGLWAVQ